MSSIVSKIIMEVLSVTCPAHSVLVIAVSVRVYVCGVCVGICACVCMWCMCVFECVRKRVHVVYVYV